MNGPTKDEVAAMVVNLHEISEKISATYPGSAAKVADTSAMLEDLSTKIAETSRLLDNMKQIERNVQLERERQFKRAEAISAQLAASEAARVAAEARVGELEKALVAIADKDDAGDHIYRADGPLAKIARAALK